MTSTGTARSTSSALVLALLLLVSVTPEIVDARVFDREVPLDAPGPGAREATALEVVEIPGGAAAERGRVGGVEMGLEPGGAQPLARPARELGDRVRAATQLRSEGAGRLPLDLGQPQDPLPGLGQAGEGGADQLAVQQLVHAVGGDEAARRGALEVLDRVLVGAATAVHGLVAHHPHEIGREAAARARSSQDRLEDLQERLLRDVVGVVMTGEAPRQTQRLGGATEQQESRAHGLRTANKVIGNAARLEPGFQAGLRRLADLPLVGEVRGMGLLGAVELVADKASKRPFAVPGQVGAIAARISHEEGLIFRAIGDTLALCPPLIATEADLAEIVSIMERVVARTAVEVAASGLAEEKAA